MRSSFVARLQEAAERILGPEESEGLLVQQLALENTNSAYRAALRGKTKSLDINGMIKLCNEVDVFSQQVSKSIDLDIGAALQLNKGEKITCYRCIQPGHFARGCPTQRQSTLVSTMPDTQQKFPPPVFALSAREAAIGHEIADLKLISTATHYLRFRETARRPP